MSLMSIKEAADCVRVSPDTIRREMAKGLLPFYKIRRSVRIKKQDLEGWKKTKRKDVRVTKHLELTKPTSAVIYESGGVNGFMPKGKSRTRYNLGFGAIYQRKTKDGEARWYADYRDGNGARIQKVIAHAITAQEATVALREEVIKAFDRKYGVKRKNRKIGFKQFARTYLQDYMMTSRRNFQSDVYRLNHLCSYFKETDLRSITPLTVERFRKERLKAGNSKSTCNRYLALMKRLFNVTIEEGYAEENPVQKVKFYSEKDTLKERILTVSEETKLMETCSDALRPIVAVALNTGMRKAEILNLQWSQVGLKARRIRVEKTKSGKVRHIPINDVLFHELRRLRNGQSPFVFFSPETMRPYVDLKRGFKAACRRAGIEGMRFHDLRHTFATRLIERGVDIETVKELLGHHSILITQRYIHSNDERKRKAVEVLNNQDEEKGKKRENLLHNRYMKNEEKSVIPLFSAN